MLRSAQSTLRQLSASALMAAAAVAVTYPASAQDVKVAANKVDVSRCDAMQDAVDGVRCVREEVIKNIDASKVRTEEARQRGQEADRRGADAERRGKDAEAVSACLDYVVNLVKTQAKDPLTGETVTKAYVKAKAGGAVNDANACSTAAQLGYGRRAEAPAPSLN